MDYSPGYNKTKPISQGKFGQFGDSCIGGAWHVDSNGEYCVRCERPFKKYPAREARDAERANLRTREDHVQAFGWDDPESLDPNIDPHEQDDYYDSKRDWSDDWPEHVS